MAQSSHYDGTSASGSHSDTANLNPSSPPVGDALCVFCHANNTFVCPVYPAKRHQWTIMNEVKDHILGMATSAPLRGENKKKWSHHHVVAQNEGWME
uniref:Uncharacterized protein n=1 Tax=Setaria italica TaxID=4555 RepID=K3ZMC9_SETIT